MIDTYKDFNNNLILSYFYENIKIHVLFEKFKLLIILVITLHREHFKVLAKGIFENF